MADHKFVYTVSGIDLSDAQKAAISQEIGVAVAKILVGASPQPVRSEFLNIVKIQGGRWLPTDVTDKSIIADYIASPGCE